MIATLTQFKQYLQVDMTGTDNDILYANLLIHAQAEIERYIDYPIEEETITGEIHDCSKVIIPNQIPINTLVVKYIAEYGVDLSDITLTENVDYFNYETYIVFESYTEGRRRIKLSYTGGYDISSVPESLIDAVIKLAAYSLNLNRPLEPNAEVDTRMPKEIKDIIDPFRQLILP